MNSPKNLLLLLMVVALVGCNDQSPQDPVLPHDTFKLDSKAVDETRRINVHLPPDFEANDRSYPVLYMPDGGIKEDFPDRLIRENEIAPVVVVGIENTVRRRDLNGPTTVERDLELAPLAGGSNTFREFIRTELVSEIERRYRTTKERAIVGESAAGSPADIEQLGCSIKSRFVQGGLLKSIAFALDWHV